MIPCVAVAGRVMLWAVSKWSLTRKPSRVVPPAEVRWAMVRPAKEYERVVLWAPAVVAWAVVGPSARVVPVASTTGRSGVISSVRAGLADPQERRRWTSEAV